MGCLITLSSGSSVAFGQTRSCTSCTSQNERLSNEGQKVSPGYSVISLKWKLRLQAAALSFIGSFEPRPLTNGICAIKTISHCLSGQRLQRRTAAPPERHDDSISVCLLVIEEKFEGCGRPRTRSASLWSLLLPTGAPIFHSHSPLSCASLA